MGEWEKAVTAFEEALKLNPETYNAAVWLAAVCAHLGRDEEAKAAAKIAISRRLPPFVFPPRVIMYRLIYKDRGLAHYVLEGLQKAGVVGTGPEYIHVSEEGQVTGEDLKTLFYPSRVSGLGPNGSQWSQEVTKDGKVTFRSASLAEGVDTGRSWLEGNKIWFQFQKYMYGMPYCLTAFKNPRGTPQGKDEYVVFTDFSTSTFSPEQ
jgi:tetratricopeptide (TPR) repeat protein